MEEEIYGGDYDPAKLDQAGAEEDQERMQEVFDKTLELEALRKEEEQQQTAEAAKAMAEVEDPRNKKQWGLKAIGTELGAAIGGGLQDTGSSLVTLPERAIDMFSGEMVEEQATEEGYKAEWDDWFVKDDNPIETKTWWGGAIRGLVHFGSMVPASVLALKAAGLGGLLAGTGVVGGTLVRGAAIGATSDLMSKYSQEANALGMVRDRFGWIDTPLSTRDTDHPAMKTLKNVVEGMGIGAFFDAASIVIGKGVKRIRGKDGKLTPIPESNQLPSGEVLLEVHPRINELPQLQKDLKDLKTTLKSEKPINQDSIPLGSKVKAADRGNIGTVVGFDESSGKFTVNFTSKKGLSQSVKFDPSQLTLTKKGKVYPSKTEAKINELEKLINEINTFKPQKVFVEDGVADEVGKAQLRAKSLRDQNVEMAMDQVKGEDFGAYKNRSMANKWQGATTSIDDIYDVDQSLKRINHEYGAEMGSAGSTYTPAGLKRIQINANMAMKDLKTVMSKYMSDARVQEEVGKAAAANKPLYELWGDAISLAQRIYEGRNTSELTASEFWSPLEKNSRLLEIDFIDTNQAKASELVIGAILKEARDSGITNRELYDIADLTDIDGPAAAMYDKLITGIIHVNTSKKLQSNSFAQFQNRGMKKPTRAQIKAEIQADAERSIQAHKLAMQLAADGDDDLFKAYMEAVSMGGDIHNLTDFDNYIRKKFGGGKFLDSKGNIVKESGLIVKGMGRVMTNSVLSGPKTPMRAILGTGTATFLRPLSMAFGASLRGDGATVRASLASLNAMREAIPEAWTLFTRNLNGYWSGDLTTIKTRFQEVTKGDQQWGMYRDWIENSGRATAGDKFTFAVGNGIRWLNDTRWLTYSTKIMGATDDAFGLILARAKAKEKAMREAMDLYNTGQITEISPEMLKKSQDDFFSQIMDADGNITDDAALYSKKEVTLTSDLHGFAKNLDKTFSSNPWTKPFLLFARTGMNGLELTAKHTPLFNRLVEESRDILKATADDLSLVQQYGITNATELANAKALREGRIAMGSGLITLASMHYVSGGLTGNGPSNRQQRQLWIDSGWKPRSIKLGDVWVSYDAFEPFNLILAAIADIGDHFEQMGPESTEKQLEKIALVVAQGLSQKSYLASMQQFVDLFAGREGQFKRIIASLMNNSMPLSSLRNELGKLFNPYMKEINSGIWQSFRNRNLFMESLAGEDAVPTKYDLLTGKPIRDWDFPTRMFNAISPFNISLDYSPGRKLLFDSKYDLRTTTYSYTQGGLNVSFKDHPHIRSMFQKAIGDQNLQYELDLLAKDPQIIASVKKMEADTWNGNKALDPMKAYYHTDIIKRLFDNAKKKAWSKIKNTPEVKQLLRESKERVMDNRKSNKQTREQPDVFNLKNK